MHTHTYTLTRAHVHTHTYKHTHTHTHTHTQKHACTHTKQFFDLTLPGQEVGSVGLQLPQHQHALPPARQEVSCVRAES